MKLENILKEHENLKKTLKEFYDECYTKSLLKTIDYKKSFFFFYKDILYVSLPYILNNFKYQTKLFYILLINNDLLEFNISVILLDNTTNLLFNYMFYDINDEYVNKDLLFEALSELYEDDDQLNSSNLFTYDSFFVNYLLSTFVKLDPYNTHNIYILTDYLNNLIFYVMEKINFHDNFYIDPDPLLDTVLTPFSKISAFNVDESIANLFNNNKPLPFPHEDNLEPVRLYEFNNTLENSSDSPDKYINSTEMKTFFINIQLKQLKFIDDILEKISFYKLDDCSSDIKKILDEHYPSELYFIRLKTHMEELLDVVSALLDNKCLFKSHYDEMSDDVNESTDLAYPNITNKNKTKIDIICKKLFFHNDYDYNDINSLFALTKKILNELPNLLEVLDIKYSPNLLELILQ